MGNEPTTYALPRFEGMEGVGLISEPHSSSVYPSLHLRPALCDMAIEGVNGTKLRGT